MLNFENDFFSSIYLRFLSFFYPQFDSSQKTILNDILLMLKISANFALSSIFDRKCQCIFDFCVFFVHRSISQKKRYYDTSLRLKISANVLLCSIFDRKCLFYSALNQTPAQKMAKNKSKISEKRLLLFLAFQCL